MECVFCKIARGEVPAQFLWKDEEVVAFRDLNPQAPHHILIVPVRHIEKISDIKEDDAKLIGKLVFVASEVAKNLKLKSYRLVFNCGKDAGQAVFHIHLHLLGGRSFSWPPG